MTSVKRSDDAVLTARERGRALRPRAMTGGLALACGFLMAATVMTGLSSEAHALRVTMKRVLFEGSKRADIIVLINNTDEEMTYRLGWRRMRMTETQAIVPIEDGDAATEVKSADDLVKYAPRRVVLPPGGSQQVRLMLRRPQDLADGEYRSHFWIEPEEAAVQFDPSPEAANAKGPAVQIKMLTGITLPVIVRAGNLSVKGAITGGTVTRGADISRVKMMVTREGNRSLYGDMEFACGSTVVHRVNGIAVYTEVSRREMEFGLRALPADCATVNVTYKAAEDDAQYHGGVIAQAALPVQ